jgi:hypothetical protein
MVGILMCALGIYILFRGSFRLAGRTVPLQRARLVGGALILPLIFEICYAPTLLANQVQVAADGSMEISREAVEAVANDLVGIQLFALLAGAGIALMLIFTLPPDEGYPNATGTRTSAGTGKNAAAPDPFEMEAARTDAPTRAEQAPPARESSHPLEGGSPRGVFREQQRPKPTTEREHPLGGFTRVPNPAAARTPKAIMNLDEAAAYLKKPREDVIALIDQGKIPAARANGSYAIARVVIDEYLAEHGRS